jgi:NADPH:quinone reductase-like Zn-dependent oxidoreductase
VAERKAKLVYADLGPHWVGAEQTPLKPFVRNALIQGAKWIQEGKLKPYINQIIKLEEVENALEKLKQGKGGFGKIVVKLL